MAQEQKYYDSIEKVKAGEKINDPTNSNNVSRDILNNGGIPTVVHNERLHNQPVAQEPVAQEPVTQEPVAQEPVAQEPVAQDPPSQEPVIDDVESGANVTLDVNETLERGENKTN